MTIDTWYTLVKYICNKSQMGGISPDEFNATANVAMRQFIAYLLGNSESYQPGRPIATVALGNNAILRQRLRQIIKKVELTFAGGEVAYPNDFLQLDSLHTKLNKRIRLVEQNYLDSYLNSVIDPVASNPIFLLEATKIRVYPDTTTKADLTYVANPADVKWAFTPDTNSRPVYDSANSVNPPFGDTDMMEIIARQLRMIGINLQEGQIGQYANELKIQGQ